MEAERKDGTDNEGALRLGLGMGPPEVLIRPCTQLNFLVYIFNE